MARSRAVAGAEVPNSGVECADVTARKAHQYTIAGATLLALVIGGAFGAFLLAMAGLVMLLGRFWPPADVIRQFVWRVAQPRGWLAARLVPEEGGTRRLARVLGGLALLAAALAVASGSWGLAAIIGLPLTAMILFDAAVDVCVLCVVTFQAKRLRFRLARPAPQR